MLQHFRVTAFTDYELLKQKKHWEREGGDKVTLTQIRVEVSVLFGTVTLFDRPLSF